MHKKRDLGQESVQQRREISAAAGVTRGREAISQGSLRKIRTAAIFGKCVTDQSTANKANKSKRQWVTGVVGPFVD